MESGYSYANQQYDFVSQVVQNVFTELAKQHNLLCYQVAIVATYDADNNRATVYFPSDMSTPSGSYKNLTNTALTVGQKVYIFHKFGDIEQGWIMAK